MEVFQRAVCWPRLSYRSALYSNICRPCLSLQGPGWLSMGLQNHLAKYSNMARYFQRLWKGRKLLQMPNMSHTYTHTHTKVTSFCNCLCFLWTIRRCLWGITEKCTCCIGIFYVKWLHHFYLLTICILMFHFRFFPIVDLFNIKHNSPVLRVETKIWRRPEPISKIGNSSRKGSVCEVISDNSILSIILLIY